MPQNCILKKGQNSKFSVIYILPQFLKSPCDPSTHYDSHPSMEVKFGWQTAGAVCSDRSKAVSLLPSASLVNIHEVLSLIETEPPNVHQNPFSVPPGCTVRPGFQVRGGHVAEVCAISRCISLQVNFLCLPWGWRGYPGPGGGGWSPAKYPRWPVIGQEMDLYCVEAMESLWVCLLWELR